MTEAQLLEAVRSAIKKAPKQEGPQGITTRELAKAQGTSEMAARRIVRTLVEGGQLAPVKVYRKRMDGQVQLQVAYAPVKGKTGAR